MDSGRVALSGISDTAETRKARGAFFTPPELAKFLTSWAIRRPLDSVLEPSCGEAAFLTEAILRLRDLGAAEIPPNQLQGVELHEQSAVSAAHAVERLGASADIAVGDFFDFSTEQRFDACIGNPPYVRYQDFIGPARLRSQEAALLHGVRLTGLASSWAAFVVHAAQMLNEAGRLALVLPAELLTVNYAAQIRRFLLNRFAKVRLVIFEERVFPGVLEEVVLLLAEGTGPTDHFELLQLADLADLAKFESMPFIWTPLDAEAKWTPALLPHDALRSYSELTTGDDFVRLETWGKTSLGMVTGNNRYFTLTPTEAADLGVGADDLLLISPPGSRHLRGLAFTMKSWEELSTADKRVYLFYPKRDKPVGAAKRYIQRGEELGINDAYKCRVRSPWWRVPLMPAPDLFVTYMNHDTPRVVANRARVRYLNSVHGIRLKPPNRQLGMDVLPIAALNSVTLLGAEIVGRSYGGGILKVEPREADVLPVPSPTLVKQTAPSLRDLRPQLATHLRVGDLAAAAKLVDDVLLVEALGMSRKDVQHLRGGREILFSRRQSRTSK